jgi:hypothetical protein
MPSLGDLILETINEINQERRNHRRRPLLWRWTIEDNRMNIQGVNTTLLRQYQRSHPDRELPYHMILNIET